MNLDRDDVEALAARVVELLRGDVGPIGPKPLTVAQVAELLGRSPDYVRSHRAELGVLASRGEKPRLMFDASKVREYLRAPTAELSTPSEVQAQRSRRSHGAADLLPIHWERAA